MMPTTTATIATSEAPTNTERSYLGRTLPDVRLANGFVRPSCSGAVVGYVRVRPRRGVSAAAATISA
jgi:hypothetical protein